MIETSADEVRTVLRNGTAELAITYDLALGARRRHRIPRRRRPVRGAAARDIGWPTGKSIRLTDLADEPMVLLDLPDSRDYFESMLAKAGVTPKIRHRTANYETVRGLVARGHGFSILNQVPAHRETYDGGTVDRRRHPRRPARACRRAGPAAIGAHHGAGACRCRCCACDLRRPQPLSAGIVWPAEVFHAEESREDRVVDECRRAYQLRNGCAGGDRFGDQGGGGFVAEQRVERGGDADRSEHGVAHAFVVGGDSLDAAFAQDVHRGGEVVERGQQGARDDRLEGVELQLPGFGGHGDGEVVADHLEGDLVDDFGDDGVHLARHDARACLHGRQVDLAEAGARAARTAGAGRCRSSTASPQLRFVTPDSWTKAPTSEVASMRFPAVRSGRPVMCAQLDRTRVPRMRGVR